MKPVLITVHGINTLGRWQEEVAIVLKPHFRCVNHKYPYYRPFGALKLICEPVVLVVAALALWWSLTTGHLSRMFALPLVLLVLFGALALIVILATSHAAARIRQYLSLKTFIRKLAKKVLPGEKPHIIAHSFGTFLVGRALERGLISLDRSVLVGCVLTSDFNWDAVLARNPKAFVDVRNEVGQHDWVVKLAYHARNLVKGLGNAGVVGFKRALSKAEIHEGNGLWDDCKSCPSAKEHIVHNVTRDDASHSSLFDGTQDAELLWLPYLWHLSPSGYRTFLELCVAAEQAVDRRQLAALDIVQGELLMTSFDWADGTLGDCINRELIARIDADPEENVEWLQERTDEAVPLIWRAITEARKLRSESKFDDTRLSLLYPPMAVGHAVDEALRRHLARVSAGSIEIRLRGTVDLET